MPEEIDPKSTEAQVALAMTAMALSFARTLQEITPDEDVLAILQTKVAAAYGQLRHTPDADVALAIFRFVRDALRNPAIIEQPTD
jgi:hypothetical protein